MSGGLLRSSWRRARARPGSPLLAILGVALGVAVVLGIDLANAASLRAMELSVERAAGRATHAIVGSPAVPVETLRQLRVDLGVRAAAPVVERDVALADSSEVLRLLGLDPFAEAPFRPYLAGADTGFAVDLDRFLGAPNAVLLGRETAERLELAVGDRFDLRIGPDRMPVQLVGTLEPRDGFDEELLRGLMIADVATAQALLGMPEALTRIDLRLAQGSAGEQVRARLESALAPGLRIEATSSRAGTLDRLTRGFRLNLEALSRLALVVGAFLVYNALSFSVVERREEFGLLRTLGATRGQVLRLVLVEAGALAACGVGLG
ncbi:MAG: ABC transporter permease, partial [Planctomycetota bacterium]